MSDTQDMIDLGICNMNLSDENKRLRAHVERAISTVKTVLNWADQKCPCNNDQPNPCPLCGASVENLEACKAADSTIPRDVLAKMRELIALHPQEPK